MERVSGARKTTMIRSDSSKKHPFVAIVVQPVSAVLCALCDLCVQRRFRNTHAFGARWRHHTS